MSEFTNPVSGSLKKLSEGEFLDLFDPALHDKILASAAKYTDAEGIVCFEVLDLGLVCRYGPERTALVVGPSNSFTLAQAAAGHLGDVPSRFKYPVAYVDYRKPDRADVIRYAVTHIDAHGMRTLTFANQGRNHRLTSEEAQRHLDEVLKNTPESTLRQCYGPAAIGTFEVRPVRCYWHGDAKECYFDTFNDEGKDV